MKALKQFKRLGNKFFGFGKVSRKVIFQYRYSGCPTEAEFKAILDEAEYFRTV